MTDITKIIKFAKQLYLVKYSTSLEECVNVAITEEIGNKDLSTHFRALGITKKDYINYIISKIEI